MARRFITERIAEGSILTNFDFYPPLIGDYERMDWEVSDEMDQVYLENAIYLKGRELGYASEADLLQAVEHIYPIDQAGISSCGTTEAIYKQKYRLS